MIRELAVEQTKADRVVGGGALGAHAALRMPIFCWIAPDIVSVDPS